MGTIPCDLSPEAYGLNQFRDLCKLRGHGFEQTRASNKSLTEWEATQGPSSQFRPVHRIVALTVHAVSSGRYSFDPISGIGVWRQFWLGKH